MSLFDPIALRTAKTPLSFGCSECNRVNDLFNRPFREFIWTSPLVSAGDV